LPRTELATLRAEGEPSRYGGGSEKREPTLRRRYKGVDRELDRLAPEADWERVIALHVSAMVAVRPVRRDAGLLTG